MVRVGAYITLEPIVVSKTALSALLDNNGSGAKLLVCANKKAGGVAMGKIKRGEELRKYAEQLGVSDHALYDAHSGTMDEPELQRRVMEAERHKRDASLWLIALISTISSVISALAAWTAIVIKSGN